VRVFIYDKHQGWLTWMWAIGSWLRALRPGPDKILRVGSWDEMVEKLQALPDGSVTRVEYWGHGTSGGVKCGKEWAWGPTMKSKDPVRYIVGPLSQVSHVLAPDAVWWWRTCNSFWGVAGKPFAKACADTLGCKVAAFTRIIWWWQGDLRIAKPSVEPDWDNTGGGYSNPFKHDTVWCMSRGPFDA